MVLLEQHTNRLGHCYINTPITSRRHGPLYHCSNMSSDGGEVRFSPVRPLHGTNVTFDSINPACLRNAPSFPTISSNLSCDQPTVSSLFTTTPSWQTPVDTVTHHIQSSGMWRCVISRAVTNISKIHTAFIFRIKHSSVAASPWRRHYKSAKCSELLAQQQCHNPEHLHPQQQHYKTSDVTLSLLQLQTALGYKTKSYLPKDRTSKACSLVCPPLSKPVSNSPLVASTTSKATSAWVAPVIMLGMKSLWPGASSSVTTFVAVSNFDCPTSIVMPRDLQKS